MKKKNKKGKSGGTHSKEKSQNYVSQGNPPLMEDTESLVYIQNDVEDHHKIYILNSSTIKNIFQREYTEVLGEHSKLFLPQIIEYIFPPLYIFNIESLDWEPARKANVVGEESTDNTHLPLNHSWSCTPASPIKSSFPILRQSPDPISVGSIKMYSIKNHLVSAEELRLQLQSCEEEIQEILQERARQVGEILDIFKESTHFNLTDFTYSLPSLSLNHSLLRLNKNLNVSLNKNAILYPWILEIDKTILSIYNGQSFPESISSKLRFQIDTISKTHFYCLGSVLLKRLILFCKKICNSLNKILKGIVYSQKSTIEGKFCIMNHRGLESLLCSTCCSSEGSEEDQYLYHFSYHEFYKNFEESKALYVLFANQLIKYYAEIQRIAGELDYIYSTVFRKTEDEMQNIRSMFLHKGFFYEIVLSEKSIINVCGITYMGLEQYAANNPIILKMQKSLKEMWIDRTQFNIA